ncbi:LysR family transcriptional regulator [Guptibacillus hwajinpoensis]|uniref:LysR family transcriptional regulator n=1 Tax=Guptibacillus hwajinpoensis TaxID=208199 RepID=UPI003734F3BC
MDMKQLATFQIASETLNFTKTAKALNYAQSSVTSQIKSLESELNVKLFERLGSKLILTSNGINFKAYADRILHDYKSALEAISNNKQTTATITVAATESQCTYKLPGILTEINDQYPNVKVIIKPIHQIDFIQSELQEGRLDFAFAFSEGLNDEQGFETTLLAEEDLVLVASPLNKANNLIKPTLKDLHDQTILLTEKGCSYRGFLENMMAESNMNFRSSYEITNVETLKNCIKSNLGIALLPYEVVREEIQTGELKRIDFNSHPIWVHYLSWHKDKVLTEIQENFISVSKNHFRNCSLLPID